MKQLLTGKVALITGATSGIGRETALLFAQEGADLILTGRREQALQTLSRELEALGVRCRYLAGDAGSSAFAEELFAYALQSLGRVDVIVCSAGMALRTPTLDMPVSEWEQVMAVNLTFPMRLSQLAVQQFLAQGGGKIVMISSTAAKNVNLGASPSYGASKAGMVYLTRHLAAEFGSRSIYANSICPGPVESEMVDSRVAAESERLGVPAETLREAIRKNIPLGRMASVDDIVRTALFLASDVSSYLTGQSLNLSGGMITEV